MFQFQILIRPPDSPLNILLMYYTDAQVENYEVKMYLVQKDTKNSSVDNAWCIF